MAEYGSFGNVSPDSMSAIKEALNRRGMGDSQSPLNTQSGASPTQSPLPAEPQGSAQMPQEPSMPTASPAVNGGNPEAKMILGAMRERLKAISVIEGGVQPKV